MKKILLTQECGQRWYRPSSWWIYYRTPSGKYKKKWQFYFRPLGFQGRRSGVAFGPIMLFWRLG